MGIESTSGGKWDAVAAQEQVDLCPLYRTDKSWRWSRIGIALEGRTGNYVDRLKVVCGSLPFDQPGLKFEVTSSPSNGIVTDRAPVTLRWHVSSARPDLMPNLSTVWQLLDHNHMQTQGLGFQEPSNFADPCAYAKAPCKKVGWYSFSSGNPVTFTGLPPGKYTLAVDAGGLKAQTLFEVRSSLVRHSPTEKLQPGTAGALGALQHNAVATEKLAPKARAVRAATAAASAPVLVLPPKQANPFATLPKTSLSTSLATPLSRPASAVPASIAGPSPTEIANPVPKSVFEGAR